MKPVGGAPVLTPFGALTPDQQAISTLVTRICDEHVYWGLVYYAWIVEGPNWRITDEKVLGFIPTFIRRLLTPSMRRGVRAYAPSWLHAAHACALLVVHV